MRIEVDERKLRELNLALAAVTTPVEFGSILDELHTAVAAALVEKKKEQAS